MLAVLGALFANGIITVFKFIAALITGSSGMMAESLHSLADTTNQVFLLLGLRFYRRPAPQLASKQILINAHAQFRDDLAAGAIERTIKEVGQNVKAAGPVVDMIFLETARRSEPGPHAPIPQHVG